MIPALVTSTGALPVGRFPCTIDEVERIFVTEMGSTERRSEIWSHFEEATAELVAQVSVRTAWIGGSFVTAKPEPDDIDVVYWIEDADLDAAATNDEAARIIGAFASQRLKSLGYRIDSYVVPWRSNPEHVQRDALDFEYQQRRGYWDDLWLRLRNGPKSAPRTRIDSFPRRGYLEVELHGFPDQ